MFILSREKSAPLPNIEWFKDGIPTREAYDFFSQVSDNNAIIQQGAFVYARYADLTAVNEEYPSPNDGLTLMVTGQGLATYKESITTWVLSADDTTSIT